MKEGVDPKSSSRQCPEWPGCSLWPSPSCYTLGCLSHSPRYGTPCPSWGSGTYLGDKYMTVGPSFSSLPGTAFHVPSEGPTIPSSLKILCCLLSVGSQAAHTPLLPEEDSLSLAWTSSYSLDPGGIISALGSCPEGAKEAERAIIRQPLSLEVTPLAGWVNASYCGTTAEDVGATRGFPG